MPKTLNARDYKFESEQATTADFDAGKHNQNTLDAGEVGEIAQAEVGAPNQGSFSAYSSIAKGGVTDPRQVSERGKPYVDLRGEDADADGTQDPLPDNTQYRLIARDKNSRSQTPLTEWRALRNADNNDPEKRNPMEFAGIDDANWVHEGILFIVQVRNPAQSITPFFKASSGTFEIPYVGAL